MNEQWSDGRWEDDARKRNLWHEMMAQQGYIIFTLDNRGTADDNVHMANTMQLIYAFENSRKPFDLMIYPRKKRHMDGQDTKAHLFNLMTDYVKRNL